MTPTQARAARRVRQARRRRMLRWGGVSALSFVAVIFIVGLILPGLPIPAWFSGAGDIFGRAATDGPGAAADLAEGVFGGAGAAGGAAAGAGTASGAGSSGAAAVREGPLGYGVSIAYKCDGADCGELEGLVQGLAAEFAGSETTVFAVENPGIEGAIMLRGSSGGRESLAEFDAGRIREFIDANASGGGGAAAGP